MRGESFLSLLFSFAIVGLTTVVFHPRGEATTEEPLPEPPRAEEAVAAASPPAPPTEQRPTSPVPPPRSSLTRVEPGESLADVARRVYGTDDRERLWRANRDLLPSPDSPLPAGGLLRTP